MSHVQLGLLRTCCNQITRNNQEKLWTCPNLCDQTQPSNISTDRLSCRPNRLLSPALVLCCSVSVHIFSCLTALRVSAEWPRSWRRWCCRGDGCGRCKCPHWTHLPRCVGLGPSWRCIRGWRWGSARRPYTSWRHSGQRDMENFCSAREPKST